MPGMLAGSRLSTFSVASVPPVEAPRPMTVCSGAPSPPKRSGAAGAAGWGRLARDNLAWEATIILWVRAWRKDSRLSTASGLRTKSTAPAASASKTRRLREETRMTGRGCDGNMLWLLPHHLGYVSLPYCCLWQSAGNVLPRYGQKE